MSDPKVRCVQPPAALCSLCCYAIGVSADLVYVVNTFLVVSASVFIPTLMNAKMAVLCPVQAAGPQPLLS